MLPAFDISEIIDKSVKDISKRVAKIDVSKEKINLLGKLEAPYTIFSAINGDYQIILSFCTDRAVLKAIAENMMHGKELNEDEVLIYTSEYFNILCGHVVSSINREFYLKSSFSVPKIVEGVDIPISHSHVRHQMFYDYSYGTAKIEALH
ncbi:chemotaxis protein CheX [Anaerotignum faecicola]|nr:chemotaxis protein CheX [Anaerotignum faecicola]